MNLSIIKVNFILLVVSSAVGMFFASSFDLEAPKTMKEFVKLLYNLEIIQSESVKQVMEKVDRAFFCKENPYVDSPQSIGYDSTISAPHMHAYVLEQIHNHFQSIIHSENDKPAILDIGSGSGYLTVAMAAFFNYKCQVIGIEHIAQLTEFAIENTKRFNQSLLNENVVKFITADGTQGWIAEAPYDVIHVGAACLPDIPQILQEQLKCGGILICPVGNNIEIQRMNIIKKDLNGKFLVIKDISVRFVPLKKK